MRISDWSSDVCSSDLGVDGETVRRPGGGIGLRAGRPAAWRLRLSPGLSGGAILSRSEGLPDLRGDREYPAHDHRARSEEHTAELQSLMRISYAVFCLKKTTK